MTQAFANLRILDFSQVIAGPFAAQLLNMLGGQVIKVEQPGIGDQMRAILPIDDPNFAGMSPGFQAYNFGKRSIAIDLKAPDAREVILKLAASSDVVVENFRAGVIDKLGFGYEAVRAVKPDIVYCSISGYGQTGPEAHRPAYDPVIQAGAGMMASTGHEATGPTKVSAFPIDISTGITAAFAIASALYRHARTGEGQHVDVAMQDTAMTLLSAHYARYLSGAPEPGLVGNGSPSGMPTSDAFETADGYLMVSTATAVQADGLLRGIGLGDRLENDPKFKDNASRIANRETVSAAIRQAMRKRSSDEWVEMLEAYKIPVGKVRNVAEVCADPQLETRGIVAEIPGPVDRSQTIKVPAAAFTASADGPGVPGGAPQLGEHTNEILHELGYDDDAIARLKLV